MEQFINNNIAWIVLVIAAWSIPWKGVALWKAAKRGDKWWFIIILVANTLAILEIVYLRWFAKDKKGSEEMWQK
jgi:hypothetical protein